jgi:hypothetical protein
MADRTSDVNDMQEQPGEQMATDGGAEATANVAGASQRVAELESQLTAARAELGPIPP